MTQPPDHYLVGFLIGSYTRSLFPKMSPEVSRSCYYPKFTALPNGWRSSFELKMTKAFWVWALGFFICTIRIAKLTLVPTMITVTKSDPKVPTFQLPRWLFQASCDQFQFQTWFPPQFDFKLALNTDRDNFATGFRRSCSSDQQEASRKLKTKQYLSMRKAWGFEASLTMHYLLKFLDRSTDNWLSLRWYPKNYRPSSGFNSIVLKFQCNPITCYFVTMTQ